MTDIVAQFSVQDLAKLAPEVGLVLVFASAMGYVVKLFVTYIKRRDESCDQCRRDMNQTMQNHVEHNTEALETLSKLVQRWLDMWENGR